MWRPLLAIVLLFSLAWGLVSAYELCQADEAADRIAHPPKTGWYIQDSDYGGYIVALTKENAKLRSRVNQLEADVRVLRRWGEKLQSPLSDPKEYPASAAALRVQTIRAIVSEQCGVPICKINSGTELAICDEMELLDVYNELSAEFDLPFSAEDQEDMMTISDISQYIGARTGKTGQSRKPARLRGCN